MTMTTDTSIHHRLNPIDDKEAILDMQSLVDANCYTDTVGKAVYKGDWSDSKVVEKLKPWRGRMGMCTDDVTPKQFTISHVKDYRQQKYGRLRTMVDKAAEAAQANNVGTRTELSQIVATVAEIQASLESLHERVQDGTNAIVTLEKNLTAFKEAIAIVYDVADFLTRNHGYTKPGEPGWVEPAKRING